MELWVLMPTGIGIITGIIGFLTKRSIDSIDQKITATNKRIDSLEDKLNTANSSFKQAVDELRHEFYEYKDKASDEFVKKVDYVMTISDMSKKMEKMYDILLDLKGRFSG